MIFKDIECLLIDMDGVILDNAYDMIFGKIKFQKLLQIVRVSDLMMQRDLLYRYLIIRKIQKIGMMSIIGPIC